MDAIKQRLLYFAKKQKLVMGDFYKKTTIASSNFSGKGAESALSTDKILQILKVFPEISPEWILLGEGEMLRNVKQNIGAVNNSTIVGANVSGNGNNISNNNLSEVIEQLFKQLETKDVQINQLLHIIDNLSANK